MNNDENKKELSAEEIIEAEKPETEKIEINSKSEVKAYNTIVMGKTQRRKKLNLLKHQDKRCLRRDLIILLGHW